MRERKSYKTISNIIVCIIFLIPLYWTLITALKDGQEIYQQPPTLFPRHLTLENFQHILTLESGLFLKYLMNSVVTTGITILLVTTVSLFAGYSFAKLKIRGKNILMFLILSALMIPFHALLNPLYSTMAGLGLLNTRLSLVLIYTTFQTPFAIYMMKNAFDAVPDSLKEAAALDGAGELGIFFKIMLPATWSSIATIVIYSAYTTWNDYLIAVVFANHENLKTLNVGLTNLAIGQYGTDWGLLTAGAFISLAPIMILFIFMQKHFIKGMLSGAVK